MSITKIEAYSETPASNVDVDGVTTDSAVADTDDVDNWMRSLMSHLAKFTGDDTVASATPDLSTVPGQYVVVTGTTTITSFGTVKAGWIKFLKFSGALTITYNATSMILPGATDLTVAAGDCMIVVSEGSGNWRCLTYYDVSGSTTTAANVTVADSGGYFTATDVEAALAELYTVSGVIGRQTMWIPAGAMEPRVTTAPAALNRVEIATSLIPLVTMDFDPVTLEYANFAVRMPKSWDESTLKASFTWSTDGSQTAGLDGVNWVLTARAFASDDALTTAFSGSASASQDHSGTADDIMITGETGTLTVAGTPGAEEWVNFRVWRNTAHAADDLDIDARLHGVTIYYTIDAGTDA